MTFYCRPTVVLSVFFLYKVFFLNLLRVDYFINNIHICINLLFVFVTNLYYSFSQLFTHKFWYLRHNDHNM